jgi:hemin uptake protein HemP
MMTRPPKRPDEAEAPASRTERTFSSSELFGGPSGGSRSERREIVIEHLGERYRLRITALGKLILTK